MSYLELKNITKDFEEVTAVKDMDLSVKKGEFIALLGGSGCGKTTTLRMIAGFIEPTEGTISIKGKIINDVPTHKRHIGIVFQDYALFPHLTVFDNIAFGLKLQKVDKTVIRKKVMDVLAMVKLHDLENRMPRELSGGQQQRVAVARALIMEPDVLLLDEPLSNLDAKLREEMQVEIRNIQKNIGITTVLVTHDQSEAMSMADRIVIMKTGEIKQVGTPRQIFEEPSSHYIADFIGNTNFIDGVVDSVSEEDGWYVVKSKEERIKVIRHAGSNFKEGDEVQISIRPENIEISGKDVPGENFFRISIQNRSYKGTVTRLMTDDFLGADLYMDIDNYSNESVGDEITIRMPYEKIKIFNK